MLGWIAAAILGFVALVFLGPKKNPAILTPPPPPKKQPSSSEAYYIWLEKMYAAGLDPHKETAAQIWTAGWEAAKRDI